VSVRTVPRSVPSPTAGRRPGVARRAAARAVSAAVAAVVAAGLLGPAPAAAATPGPHAVAGATWIADQVRQGRIHNNQFDFDDWGLTLDSFLALVATRREAATAVRLIGTTSRHADEYVQIDGNVLAGPAAKLLLSLRVARRDAAVQIGGETVNLRGRLLTMVAPSGRVRDEGSSDFSSTLTQSLAVLAFSRSGRAPQKVVDYLVRQRCHAGFFREALRARTCAEAGSAPYVDSTAFALQALVAARADGADLPKRALRETAAWLRKVQNPNGGWSAPASSRGLNTNTTGVAAQALAAMPDSRRNKRAIQAAAGYVRRHQITRARADGGPAADEVGAIARNRADLNNALANGIRKGTRDSFRRATVQAQFALVPVPLGKLKIPR